MDKTAKKALSISGGAFKIPFLAGAAIEASRLEDFSILQGTSSGAIVALCIAAGRIEELERRVLTFGAKDVFRQNPNKLGGKLRAFWRVMRGKEYLFDQSRLLETIKDVISKDDFEKYQNNVHSPDCYVGVSPKGKLYTKYINVKKLTYEMACRAVLASSSIPNATQEVFLNGEFLVDGGAHEHIGSHWLLRNHGDVLDELVCLYSRPSRHWLDENYVSWTSRKPKWFSFAFFKDLLNSYEDAQLSNSMDEETKTMLFADSLGIKVRNIFAPNLLSEELYKATDREKARWLHLGRDAYYKSA